MQVNATTVANIDFERASEIEDRALRIAGLCSCILRANTEDAIGYPVLVMRDLAEEIIKIAYGKEK